MAEDFLQPSVIWFILGLILIILEFIIPGLITIFFGIGAWIVAIISLIIPIPVIVQLLIFIICSIISLVMLRNWFKSFFSGRIGSGGEDTMDSDEFLYQKAVVTQEITPEKKGKVEFHGTQWDAEAYEKITKGKTVEIIDKKSITLIVRSI